MGSDEESDRFAHAVEPASVVEQLRQIRVLGQRHHRHQATATARYHSSPAKSARSSRFLIVVRKRAASAPSTIRWS
jgi:hypothetical protein